VKLDEVFAVTEVSTFWIINQVSSDYKLYT